MKRHQRPAAEPPARQGHGRGRDEIRVTIAQAAARLIAEGLTDYRAAKQKAARQLGITDAHALPDNHEIESALREQHALFAHDSQPKALSAFRETALSLMAHLETFSPWLVGAVLAGTANEFSEIELELVGIEAKDFEMYLLNAGVEFQVSEMRSAHDRKAQAAIIFSVEFAGAPVSITLYEHHAARQTAHPRGSVKHDRVNRAEAEKRFSESETKL